MLGGTKMIRFGIIGTNWITDAFIEAASHDPDFTLTAVYSRTESKALEFAAKYKVETVFTDVEEMAKSNKVDAVYIASPTSFHAVQAIVFLKHGKHVLCEKPIASNSKELDAIFKAAKENNVLVMEAMKSTLLPSFNALKLNLHKIGRVRKYIGNYCQYSSRYDQYKEGVVLNAFKPEFSNGALMDLGIYCLYPMVVLFGKPNCIKASSVMLESGVDAEGSIVMEYADMDAVVMFSKITNSYIPSEIQGEEGSILIDKISSPEKLEIRYRDGRVEHLEVTQNKPSMYYEAAEFIKLIKNGEKESLVNSYDHSRITAEIMEEARKQIGLIYPADEQ